MTTKGLVSASSDIYIKGCRRMWGGLGKAGGSRRSSVPGEKRCLMIMCFDTANFGAHEYPSVRHLDHLSDQKPGARSTVDRRDIHTRTYTYGNLQYPLDFGLREETGASRGNPRRHRENTHTPHKQGPSRSTGLNPLWGESANHCAAMVHATAEKHVFKKHSNGKKF